MSSISYDPKEYWMQQGKVYKSNFRRNSKFELQEKLLIEYLTNNVFSPTLNDPQSYPKKFSILEVGCGFGRITRLLLVTFGKSIKKYVAVDLSPDQIKNAKEYTGYPSMNAQSVGKIDNNDSNDQFLKFVTSDIQSLRSNECFAQKYDLVLACEVLLHVLPSEIEQVMHLLTEMSDKHVINVDWYEEKIPKKVAPHNFIHQYERLYKNIPSIKQVNRIPIVKKGLLSGLNTKQSIFHAMKE
jgi:SAM-dependent methyltransferase